MRSLMGSSSPLGICITVGQRLRKDPLLYQLFNLLEVVETRAEFSEEILEAISNIYRGGRRKHPIPNNYPMVY
jgi:hypothetical protein